LAASSAAAFYYSSPTQTTNSDSNENLFLKNYHSTNIFGSTSSGSSTETQSLDSSSCLVTPPRSTAGNLFDSATKTNCTNDLDSSIGLDLNWTNFKQYMSTSNNCGNLPTNTHSNEINFNSKNDNIIPQNNYAIIMTQDKLQDPLNLNFGISQVKKKLRQGKNEKKN
jgi:hypothetical protein